MCVERNIFLGCLILLYSFTNCIKYVWDYSLTLLLCMQTRELSRRNFWKFNTIEWIWYIWFIDQTQILDVTLWLSALHLNSAISSQFLICRPYSISLNVYFRAGAPCNLSVRELCLFCSYREIGAYVCPPAPAALTQSWASSQAPVKSCNPISQHSSLPTSFTCRWSSEYAQSDTRLSVCHSRLLQRCLRLQIRGWCPSSPGYATTPSAVLMGHWLFWRVLVTLAKQPKGLWSLYAFNLGKIPEI